MYEKTVAVDKTGWYNVCTFLNNLFNCQQRLYTKYEAKLGQFPTHLEKGRCGPPWFLILFHLKSAEPLLIEGWNLLLPLMRTEWIILGVDRPGPSLKMMTNWQTLRMGCDLGLTLDDWVELHTESSVFPAFSLRFQMGWGYVSKKELLDPLHKDISAKGCRDDS